MGKKILSIGLLLLMFAAITGCGNAQNGQTSALPKDENTVLIQDYKFQPAEITVKKGETVTWINKDAVQHTATGDSFDSGLLRKDQSFKQTFDKAGTYDYICTPHPYMKGKIHVE